MRVDNVSAAKRYLQAFSWYNVVNGYADLFLDSDKSGNYKDGCSFKELRALHHFDEGLRRCLTHYVLKVESIVKSLATYHFCLAKNEDGSPKRSPCDYLSASSYDPARTQKVNKLLSDLSDVIHSGESNPGPIKEYVHAHINPPPIWVLATGMSFGNTLKFYECLFPSERDQVARYFGITDDALDSFLIVLRDFRNALAHSNRVYCFKTVHRPKRVVSFNGEIDRLENAAEKRFGSVLFVLHYLLPATDFRRMINEISTLTKGLSKILITATILDVMSEMGLPQSMRIKYGVKIA